LEAAVSFVDDLHTLQVLRRDAMLLRKTSGQGSYLIATTLASVASETHVRTGIAVLVCHEVTLHTVDVGGDQDLCLGDLAHVKGDA
jgi:uncharacterized protein YaaW (UPF0174 family)